MTVIETSDTTAIADAIDSDSVVVVDFGAESWCVPCQRLRPVFDAVADKVNATLIRADIEDNPELAEFYGILTVPSLLAFKGGEYVGRVNARTAVALVREINSL